MILNLSPWNIASLVLAVAAAAMVLVGASDGLGLLSDSYRL